MEPWLKVLKVFVVVAGLVLLVGTTAFVYLVLDKRTADRAGAAARQSGPPEPIIIPPDSQVVDLRLEQGRALVMLRDAAGRNYLLLVDVAAGRRLGLVVLRPDVP